MYEYIKRSDAINEVNRGDLLVGNNAEWAIEIICRTPYADVTKVKRGNWIKNWCDTGMIGHEYAECSLCGCQMIDTNVFWNSKFCPHCGAQMTKEN